jgi:hypothetical protein
VGGGLLFLIARLQGRAQQVPLDNPLERAIERLRAFINLDFAGYFDEPLELLGVIGLGLRLAGHVSMIPEKEGLASGAAAEPERFCWSCFRPLIPGIDDVPIALQDQILQSYKIFHCVSRPSQAHRATFVDQAALSARHFRQASRHFFAALRLLLPLGGNAANRAGVEIE